MITLFNSFSDYLSARLAVYLRLVSCVKSVSD